jgi:hypothetical protein
MPVDLAAHPRSGYASRSACASKTARWVVAHEHHSFALLT